MTDKDKSIDEDEDEEIKIPPNQTVTIGSIWDLREEPGPNQTTVGLFEVKKIENGIAYNDEDIDSDDTLALDIDDLANYFLKLTPEEAKQIRHEEREYHKSTIQPIKGPNGKIIQVGSVWHIKEPDDDLPHDFEVGSLQGPSAVFMGSEYGGMGTGAETLFKYGTEVPLNQLHEHTSDDIKRKLESEIFENQKEGNSILVTRHLNNGKLERYGISIQAEHQPNPKVKFKDIELSPEEKLKIEQDYQNYFDWVKKERELAAEGKLKLLSHNKIKIPLLSREEQVKTKDKTPEITSLLNKSFKGQYKLNDKRLKA